MMKHFKDARAAARASLNSAYAQLSADQRSAFDELVEEAREQMGAAIKAGHMSCEYTPKHSDQELCAVMVDELRLLGYTASCRHSPASACSPRSCNAGCSPAGCGRVTPATTTLTIAWSPR